MAISWTIGSIIGCQIGYPWWMWLILLVASMPWLILASSRRHVRIVVLILACGLFSIGRAAHRTQVVAPNAIQQWVGSSHGGPARVLLRVGQVQSDGQMNCDVLAWHEPNPVDLWNESNGTLLLRSHGVVVLSGSIIDVTGRIRTGLGRDGRRVSMTVFSESHCHTIHPPSSWVAWLRFIQNGVASTLLSQPLSSDIPQSATSAIVLGYRDTLWKKMSTPFRSTGTAHLLAVSGLHLAILCGFVLITTRWSGVFIRRGFIMVVLVTIMMLCVAQVRTPLSRAGFMVIVASTLASIRWRLSAGSVLALAAISIEYAQPRIVLDVGFQLSFSVVAGLIYLVPLWSHRVSTVGVTPSRIGSSIRATTVAWLIATPLSAHHFGMYSLLGIPATIVLFPLISGILIVGYLRILVFWWDWPHSLAAWILNTLCDVLWNTVRVFDQIPGSGIEINPPNWWWVAIMELLAIIIVVCRSQQTRCLGVFALVVLWFLATAA
jgi:ComEC/Rec2-related protein